MWTWAVVLRRIGTALDGKELDRALMGLSYLLLALLRKARRGGKAGIGNVACRFNYVGRGDWGALVDMWELDVKKEEEDEPNRGGYKRHNEEK